MADIKLTIDDSQVIQTLENLEKKFGQTGSKAASAFYGVFDFSEAGDAVKTLDLLQKEFDQIKKSADVLKGAMRNATDPALIKSYAENVAKLERGMVELEKAGKAVGVNLRQVNKEAGIGKQVFEGVFGAFTKATIIIEAIELVRKFTAQSINLATQVSRAQKQFEAFSGSAEVAAKQVAELQSFANKKILPTQEVLDAGKGLLAFGEEANNVIPVLGRIADISKATGKNFGELTTIYGKARAAGVLYAEDINQLVDAGIPIIGEFAKQMGVSTGEVKKLASEGKISFEQLQLAFFNLTSEGGKFAGQAEAGTQAGDRFNAAWTKALTQVGGVLKPAWDFVLNSLASIIGSISKLGEAKGLEDFSRKFFNFFSEINPAFAFFKNKIETFFPSTKGKIEIDYTGRDAYEQAKDDLFERQRLEEAAAKSSATRAKKSAAELANIEKEKAKLRIDAMQEGEAKEIALENLRFEELVKQLKKYHIDTSEAEKQHQKNLVEIIYNFASERAGAEQKLIDLRKAQGEFEAKQAKEGLDRKRVEIKTQKELSELRIEITEAEFANLIASLRAGGADEQAIKEQELEFSKRINAQKLQAQLDYQKALLALGGNEKELAIIQAEIQKLQTLLDGIDIPEPNGNGGKPKDLFDLLGINFDDEQKDAFKEAVGEIIDSLGQLAGARLNEAQAAVDAANEKVQAAEDALERENDLAKEGLANNSDNAKKALEEAKKLRDNALKEEQKAKRAQIALDSIGQVSNLISASAQTLAKFNGPLLPLGIVLVAAMFAAFAAAKAKALKAAEAPKLRKGMRFEGATHEEGGEDIVLDGKRPYKVEKGEWLIGTEHSREHDRFLANMNKGAYRGINLLAKVGSHRSDREHPLGESVRRIHRTEARRADIAAQTQYEALARAYERSADKIVREIREKPTVLPWKGGHKIVVHKENGGTETRTVLPAE